MIFCYGEDKRIFNFFGELKKIIFVKGYIRGFLEVGGRQNGGEERIQ